MNEDSNTTIAHSARRFSYGTLISRFTGLFREVAMAAAFGALPAVAAFWMAFRFAHLFRRIFGEGALHAAFIPHFERLKSQNVSEAAFFFYRLTTTLSTFLLIFVVILEGGLGAFLAWGSLTPGSKEIITLTMLLLPSLVFISLFALNSSFLNCEKSYFLPSVAPTALNLIWIGAIIFLWRYPPYLAMRMLAMLLVFAFAAQWVATLPSVYGKLTLYLKNGGAAQEKRGAKEIFRLITPFALGVLGVAATQINSALDALFARAADPAGPAMLWYAIRLQQLPLALFGVGITSALLPPIARAIEQKKSEKANRFFLFAQSRTSTLMLPITAAFLACGLPLVNLVYGRGAFTEGATSQTGLALFCYALGLLPMTFVLLRASAFYAQKNYRTPALVSCGALGLNISLNAVFVFAIGWGAASVALATSATAFVHAATLGYLLRKKMGDAPFSWKRMALVSGMAAVATILVSSKVFHANTAALMLNRPLAPFAREFFAQIALFLATSLMFALSWVGLAMLFGVQKLIPEARNDFLN